MKPAPFRKPRPWGLAMLAAVTGAVTVAGCGAQVTPRYQGEPMATVRGTIVTGATPAPAGVSAAIVWQTSTQDDGGQKFVGSRVAVQGTFPAEFTLDVYDPPPLEGEILGPPPSFAPTGAWVGVLAALAPNTPDGDVHPRDIAGADPGHVVLYFDHDEVLAPGVPPASQGPAAKAHDYGVPATRGYHLAVVNHGDPNLLADYERCIFGGVCVHSTNDPDEWVQSENDGMYSRCLSVEPHPTTCAIDESDAQPTPEDAMCSQLQGAAIANSKCDTPPGYGSEPNPKGFDDPATILLGHFVWEPFWL